MAADSMAHEHVVAGIAAALHAGALTADAVAVEARKAAQADTADAASPDPPAEPIPQPPQVVSLTRRRVRTLPANTRPPPSVAAYDQLLSHRPQPRPASEGDLP